MNARARTVIGLGWALAAAAGMSCRTETAGPDAVAGVVDGTVAMVRTITGGRLIEWSAAAGREVAAGEVLGRIDPGRLDNETEVLALAEREIRIAEERIRVQIPALQARADFLRKQAERLDRLRSEKAVSGGEVEKNRVDLLAAEAALAESSKALAAQTVEREKLAAKRRALDLAKEDLALRSPGSGPHHGRSGLGRRDPPSRGSRGRDPGHVQPLHRGPCRGRGARPAGGGRRRRHPRRRAGRRKLARAHLRDRLESRVLAELHDHRERAEGPSLQGQDPRLGARRALQARHARDRRLRPLAARLARGT